MVFLVFWGNPDEVGSLTHMKAILNRGKVDREAKNFQASDEFLHSALESYLVVYHSLAFWALNAQILR